MSFRDNPFGEIRLPLVLGAVAGAYIQLLLVVMVALVVVEEAAVADDLENYLCYYNEYYYLYMNY